MITLDVSEMAPPEPYRQAVEALIEMPHGSLLKMVHRKEPYPLYQTAAEMGFYHKTTYLDDGVVQILFWHKDDSEIAERHLAE